MIHHNRIQGTKLQDWIDVFNAVVLWIFIAEFIAKFSCMGLNYFKDGWNIFDFTVLAIIMFSKVLFN
jgi:hypothetical protein